MMYSCLRLPQLLLFTESDCEEVQELSDAYKVMSKMAADYIHMETSISQQSEEPQRTSTARLPVLQISSEQRHQFTLKHANPALFKEGIVICRDW